MKFMQSESKSLWNLIQPSLLVVLGLIFSVGLVAACGKSGGGGRFEEVCEDYCATIVRCVEIPEAEDDCNSDCIDDLEDAEEIDGVACSNAQTAAFVCVAQLECNEVLEFANLTASDLPTPYCTAPITDSVDLCVETIQL
jgi:hypothetical protein